MRFLAIIFCRGCLLSCQEEHRPATDYIEAFVGTAQNLEAWPYCYTIATDGKVWKGEIDFVQDGYSMPFDRMKFFESSEHYLVFGALFGGPGKALPCEWRMSLSSTAFGMEATLTTLNIEDFDPVVIRFEASNERRMPSETTTA